MWSMGGRRGRRCGCGRGWDGRGQYGASISFYGQAVYLCNPVHTVLITRIARVINLSEILLKLLSPGPSRALSH